MNSWMTYLLNIAYIQMIRAKKLKVVRRSLLHQGLLRLGPCSWRRRRILSNCKLMLVALTMMKMMKTTSIQNTVNILMMRISVMRMIVRLQMKMMMQTFQWMLRTRIGQQKHPWRHLQRRRPGWQLHLRATILLWNVTFEVLIVKLLTLTFVSMPPKSHFLMNFPFRQWHWYKKCLCPCGHPLSIQVREEPALLKRRTPTTSDKPMQPAANLAAGLSAPTSLWSISVVLINELEYFLQKPGLRILGTWLN